MSHEMQETEADRQGREQVRDAKWRLESTADGQGDLKTAWRMMLLRTPVKHCPDHESTPKEWTRFRLQYKVRYDALFEEMCGYDMSPQEVPGAMFRMGAARDHMLQRCFGSNVHRQKLERSLGGRTTEGRRPKPDTDLNKNMMAFLVENLGMSIDSAAKKLSAEHAAHAANATAIRDIISKAIGAVANTIETRAQLYFKRVYTKYRDGEKLSGGMGNEPHLALIEAMRTISRVNKHERMAWHQSVMEWYASLQHERVAEIIAIFQYIDLLQILPVGHGLKTSTSGAGDISCEEELQVMQSLADAQIDLERMGIINGRSPSCRVPKAVQDALVGFSDFSSRNNASRGERGTAVEFFL